MFFLPFRMYRRAGQKTYSVSSPQIQYMAMPSLFLLTCVRLTTPYSIRKGHFAFVHLKALGNLRTAWVHDVSIVSQCLFSISSHRTEEQSVGRFQQVHWLECTRLGHRYHRGALPLPGLGIFPTGMGQISFAFLHFVV